MIFDTLAQADRYASLHPLFPAAFDFLRAADLDALAPGRHDVLDERIFVIVEDGVGRAHVEAKLECHRRYIDIQLVLAGVDEMGWKPLAECTQLATPYSDVPDIAFFDDAPKAWIATPPGAFCLFFPEDAHAPWVSPARLRKVVVKVAVAGVS